MPIGITEEHLALHAAARGWAERHSPPAVLRAQLEAGTEALPEFWPDLVAQGWTGLHLEEAFGGEGYGIPELAVVLEELGFAGAPGPFLATTLAGRAAPGRGKGRSVGARPAPRGRLAHRHGRALGLAGGGAGCGRRAEGERHVAPGALGSSRVAADRERGRHLGGAAGRRVRSARARQRGPDPSRRGDHRLRRDDPAAPAAAGPHDPDRARPRRGLVLGRRRRRLAVVRPDRVGVREGPPAIRPPHRPVPRREAPLRQHARSHRAGAASRRGTRPAPSATRKPSRSRPRPRRHCRSTATSRPRRTACRPSVASASRGSTTRTSTSGGRPRRARCSALRPRGRSGRPGSRSRARSGA